MHAEALDNVPKIHSKNSKFEFEKNRKIWNSKYLKSSKFETFEKRSRTCKMAPTEPQVYLRFWFLVKIGQYKIIGSIVDV